MGRTEGAWEQALTNTGLNDDIMIIVVLDYTVGDVTIKKVPKEFEGLDGDDILTNMGYKMSDTNYMITDDVMQVSIDTKGCSSKLTLN